MRKAERYFPFLATTVFALILFGILLFRNAMTGDIPNRVPQEEMVSPDSGRININTAGADELTILPGIGDSLAARIIAYREENGGFSSIYEITQVSGIGEESFLGLRDYITVGGQYENTGCG